MSPTLRPYQRAALEAIDNAMGDGLNRLLMRAATGTGKTVTFASMLQWPNLRDWLDTFPSTERKMLIIAHREELLEQAARKIHAANPHARVDIEQAERYASRHADVVIASVQTLSAQKFKRMKRLLAHHVFRIVIVDEAHHAAAASYRTCLAHLGFLPMADATDEENVEAANFDDVAKMSAALAGWDQRAPKDRLLVGVTATPNRSDAIGLGCVFQTIAFSYDLKAAISDGWLVPIVPWVVETQESLDAVKLNRGDFNQKDLAEAVNQARRNRLAVASWHQYAAGRKTIAFTVDVAHAHALAAEFEHAGVNAVALSGMTPADERRNILRRFETGDIDVITNCMVLTEGTDLPIASCILHAKPTKSATLYEQMTGRGLRILEGKTDCIVIDLVDVARRHSLQTAPVLYGLPPGMKAQGKDLKQCAEWLERLKAENQGFQLDENERLTLDEIAARAKSFDIWTVPAMGEVGADLSMQWIPSGEDAYRLQYPWQDGTETIVVAKDLLEKFAVIITARSTIRSAAGSVTFETAPSRTIAQGVGTAHEALKLAEAWVAAERRTVAKLKDRDAPWRNGPASSKQIGLLNKLAPKDATGRKVPLPRGLTAGRASDMIDMALNRSRRAK